MSNSLAAAKKRRAGIQTSQPIGSSSNSGTCSINASRPPVQQKLTIPMYLGQLETRLKELESKPKDLNIQLQVESPEGTKQMNLTDYMLEMDNKFNMLIGELTDLKSTLFDLQRFTMNVNEKLFTKVNETSPQDILENIIQESNEETPKEETPNEETPNEETPNEEKPNNKQ